MIRWLAPSCALALLLACGTGTSDIPTSDPNAGGGGGSGGRENDAGGGGGAGGSAGAGRDAGRGVDASSGMGDAIAVVSGDGEVVLSGWPGTDPLLVRVTKGGL